MGNIAKLCQQSAKRFMDGETNDEIFVRELVRILRSYRDDNSIIDIGKALQDMELD